MHHHATVAVAGANGACLLLLILNRLELGTMVLEPLLKIRLIVPGGEALRFRFSKPVLHSWD